MKLRGIVFFVVAILAGCQGPTRVPPPGTQGFGQPNGYYQPPTQPFTAPNYGTSGAAPAVTMPPGFSSANRTNVSLAADGATSDNLNWGSVSKQPSIAKGTTSSPSSISPIATLTAGRASTAVSTPSPTLVSRPVEISQIPGTTSGPSAYTTPSTAAPVYPANPNYGAIPRVSQAPDPWRGR